MRRLKRSLKAGDFYKWQSFVEQEEDPSNLKVEHLYSAQNAYETYLLRETLNHLLDKNPWIPDRDMKSFLFNKERAKKAEPKFTGPGPVKMTQDELDRRTAMSQAKWLTAVGFTAAPEGV